MNWQDVRLAWANLIWLIATIWTRVIDWLPQNITTISLILSIILTIIIIRNQLQLYEKTRIEIELLRTKIKEGEED